MAKFVDNLLPALTLVRLVEGVMGLNLALEVNARTRFDGVERQKMVDIIIATDAVEVFIIM